MTVTVKHSTVATLPDEAGAEVNKAEWNANHTIAGLGSAAESATTDFDAAGAATAAVATHVGLADPHTQYALESSLTAVATAGTYASLTGIPATFAPSAHATSHNAGGSDVMAIDAAAGTGSLRTIGTTATAACAGNDVRLSDSRAPNGSASGDLAGSYPNPTVTQARGLRETAGPTTLSIGSVADGEFLKRSGTTIISAAPPAGDTSKVISSGTSTISADTCRQIVRRLTIASGAHLVIAATGSLGIWA